MRELKLPLFVWWLLVALPGCGDPLLGGDYRGVPIFQVKARLVNLQFQDGIDDVLRASIFWFAPDGSFREQTSVSTDVNLSATVELLFYRPPEEEDLYSSIDRFAIGFLGLYVDRDADGKWMVDNDALVGGVPTRGLAWSEPGVASHPLPGMSALEPGFSLVDSVSRCDDSTPPLPPPDEMDLPQPPEVPVELDQFVCTTDDDCEARSTCELELHICVPSLPLDLIVSEAFQPPTLFCP